MRWLAPYLFLLVGAAEGQCLLQTFLQRHSGASAAEDTAELGRRRRRAKKAKPSQASESPVMPPMVGIFGYATPKCDLKQLKDASPGSATASFCHVGGKLLWWDNWDEGEAVGVECQESCCAKLVKAAETQCGGSVTGPVECTAMAKEAPSRYREPPSGVLVGAGKALKSKFPRPPSFEYEGNTLLCQAFEGLKTEEEVWNPIEWNEKLDEMGEHDVPRFEDFGMGACNSDVGIPTFFWKEGLTQLKCEAACSDWCQAYQTGLPDNKVGCALYPADDESGPPPGFQISEGSGVAKISSVDPVPGFNCFRKSDDGISLDEVAQTCSVTTVAETGGECYFDREREDCAVCAPGACQCGEGAEHRCVPCGDAGPCAAEAQLPLCADEAPCPKNCLGGSGLVKWNFCDDEKCELCGIERRKNCKGAFCPKSKCLGGAGLVRSNMCDAEICSECSAEQMKFCHCAKDCLGGAGLVRKHLCGEKRCEGCGGDLRKFCDAPCTTGNFYNSRQTAVYGCRSDVLSAGTKFCVQGETFTVGSSWNTGGGASVNLASGEKFPKGLFTKGVELRVGACSSTSQMTLVHGHSEVNVSSKEHLGSAATAHRTGKFRKLGVGYCMGENGLPKLYSDSVISREFCETTCGSASWCQAYHFGENGNCALFVSADAEDDAPPHGFTLASGIGAAEVTTTDSTQTHWTCYKSIIE